MRIVSWNETKLVCKNVTSKLAFVNGFNDSFWAFSSQREGYSGVVTYCKVTPVAVWDTIDAENPALDAEGRCIITDHGSLVVFNVYAPNGGRGAERVQFKLDYYAALERRMLEFSNAGRHVVLVGDMNTCHRNQDVWVDHPNESVSSFLPTERAWFDNLFDVHHYQDAYRIFKPSYNKGFTWWDPKSEARKFNQGWRLDYCITSPSLSSPTQLIQDSGILSDVYGSDHCPVFVDVLLDCIPPPPNAPRLPFSSYNFPQIRSERAQKSLSSFFSKAAASSSESTAIIASSSDTPKLSAVIPTPTVPSSAYEASAVNSSTLKDRPKKEEKKEEKQEEKKEEKVQAISREKRSAFAMMMSSSSAKDVSGKADGAKRKKK